MGGISKIVFDINASRPSVVAIVDGIDCMEGDGPIQGTLKHMGWIAISGNATAAGATVRRLMGIEPALVPHLRIARGRLGPLEESRLSQRGKCWRGAASPFEILDQPHLRWYMTSRPTDTELRR